MMNIRHRYGIMLLCGRLPPVMDVANGFIGTLLPVGAYMGGAPRPPPAQTAFCGLLVPPPAETHCAKWLWFGISVVSSVTFCSPPVSPRSRRLKPGPWPCCNGAEPWRLGRAKLVFPSPPYVVPRRENRAVFWLMGKSCPSQVAQPMVAKFPAKILISATN